MDVIERISERNKRDKVCSIKSDIKAQIDLFRSEAPVEKRCAIGGERGKEIKEIKICREAEKEKELVGSMDSGFPEGIMCSDSN